MDDKIFYPWTMQENLARLGGEDMDDLSYPPYDRRRYRNSGVEKLRAAGITVEVWLDVRDFGAVPNES